MAPRKTQKSTSKTNSNFTPKLIVSNNKIFKAKHARPAKQTLFLRRSVRLNPYPFVFGTQSPDLQAMICWKVLNNFDSIQQLKFRAVSPMWDYNVRIGCRHVRGVTFNFANVENLSRIKVLYRIKYDKIIEINMKEEELTHSTIEVLGKLYYNIEALNFFYDSIQDADKLFKILQQFPKVTDFVLFVFPQIETETGYFFNRMFATINEHFSPLTRLDLYFRDYDKKVFPKLHLEQFGNCLSLLRHFYINIKFENMNEFFEWLGKDLSFYQPIQQILTSASAFELEQIAPMFEHNPKLSRTRILKLYVHNFDVLDCLLSHFNKLRALHLLRLPELEEDPLSIEYIRTIGKLAHLKQLVLKNFPLISINQLSVSFRRVRQLHITHETFYEDILTDWHSTRGVLVQSWREMFRPFVESFAKQFPKLNELTIVTNLWNFEDFMNEFCNLCFKVFSNLRLISHQDVEQE